ncbi:MAG: hypothetical protein ACYSOT_02855, partial [Planctomycetota bacterium]
MADSAMLDNRRFGSLSGSQMKPELAFIGRMAVKIKINTKNTEVLSMKAPQLEKIEIEQVWTEYFQTRSEDCRNKLMENYLRLVKYA